MEKVPDIKDTVNSWSELAERSLSSGTSWNDLAELDDYGAFERERNREKLYERVIDMTTVEAGKLREDFVSGIYLFHGAKVEQIEKILKSGELLNAGELYDRMLSAKRSELEAEGKSKEEIQSELKRISFARNSGQEGISWSVNGIDALPGTRGHLAGFVAAPEDVLSDNKLVMPSRPAPYELLQVSDELETKAFFEIKKQNDVWGYKQASMFETASVDSGLMRLIMAAKYERENPGIGEDDFKRKLFHPLLLSFVERGGVSAEELRTKYKMHENGDVELVPDLHQQKFDENYIPPAAVWMQAMIDKGMFNNTSCDGMNVMELVQRSFEDEKLPNYMLYWAREQGKKYEERYEAELDKAQGVALPIEKMYLVASHHDLDGWIDKMLEARHLPKGILLYDDEKVVKENFAQAELGDHGELADEIGRVVGADEDFWQDRMGVNIDTAPRAGHMGQVLADQAVRHDLEVKLINGRVAVTRV